MSRLISLVTVLALLVLAALAGSLVSPGLAASRCAVSRPSSKPLAAGFNVGNSRIAVGLPPRATYVAVPEGQPGWAWIQSDGTIRAKIGWWRARGTLQLSGHRLDGQARPLRADVAPPSFGPAGEFFPSNVVFSSAGCWKITARAGGARLDVVVRVVKR